MPAARAQVMLFLVEAKKLIASGSCTFIKRKKNLDALALLGWTTEILFDCLCTLTPENYVNGPDIDIDFPGEDVWIFGAVIERPRALYKAENTQVRRQRRRADAMSLISSGGIPIDISF